MPRFASGGLALPYMEDEEQRLARLRGGPPPMMEAAPSPLPMAGPPPMPPPTLDMAGPPPLAAVPMAPTINVAPPPIQQPQPMLDSYTKRAADFQAKLDKPVPWWKQALAGVASVSPRTRGIAPLITGEAGLNRQGQALDVSGRLANEEQQQRQQQAMEQHRQQQIAQGQETNRLRGERNAVLNQPKPPAPLVIPRGAKVRMPDGTMVDNPIPPPAPRPEPPSSLIEVTPDAGKRLGIVPSAEGKYLAPQGAVRPPRPTAQSSSGGSVGGEDPKLIAQAIVEGKQPPLLTGLYRAGTPVRAQLQRLGYDLSTAQRDWQAVQKHIATLNGPQQERLRQAVTFTYDSLDIIDGLYKEWESLGKAHGMKMFNKAELGVAKQLSGRAGEVAQNLEAQINDLTAELGTVYKGGNASTDESLRLAAENLKADWNPQTFRRAIEQIRQNLRIRKNSIMSSQPVGVSQNSPYLPKGESPAPQQQADPLGIR